MPAQLRCLLLYSATSSALAPHFQAGSAQPQDTTGFAAAGALFQRLLGQARSLAQLKALEVLLDQVWDSGHAFDAVQQQPSEKHTADLPSMQQDERPDSEETSSSIADPGAARVQPLEPAATSEQASKSQDSAPGTPPAEESRWPTTAAQPDAADGWDEADQLQPFGEPIVPSESTAYAADGWDLEDTPDILPELAQEAVEQAQSASTAESKSGRENSDVTALAAAQAADPSAAADGWEADDGLELPLQAHVASGSAQAAASALQAQHGLMDHGETASESSPTGWDSNADLLENLPPLAMVNKAGHGPTLGANSDHVGVSQGADASKTSAEGAQAAEESLLESRKKASGIHLDADQTHGGSMGTSRVRPAGGEEVPMHACWSALLLRMLAAPERHLAGGVLARLEKAQMQQAVLVSEAEADALLTASAQAGRALSNIGVPTEED